MNKAFVRESEGLDDVKCPRCGAIGLSVGPQTLAAHLGADARRRLGDEAFYCANPGCDAGYFDELARVVDASEIRDPAWPKHPAGPVCSCFGVTADQIESAAAQKNPAVVRDLIARSTTASARCATTAPSGACCVAVAQRLYLRAPANK